MKPLGVNTIREFIAAVRPNRYETPKSGTALLNVEVELTGAWEIIRKLPIEELNRIRQSLSEIEAMYVWYYAVRIAEVAVRAGDSKLIRAALMALIVLPDSFAPRDIWSALALVNDAGLRTGAARKQLLQEVAELATPQRRHTIIQYAEDHENDQTPGSLYGVGFEAVGEGMEFRYQSVI